jgi:DNA invertase Pin-like site-specific DNA recombinase
LCDQAEIQCTERYAGFFIGIMRVVAYRYCASSGPIEWSPVFAAWPIDRFYEDFEMANVLGDGKTPGFRPQLQQLLGDGREVAADLLLVENWAELADSMVGLEQVLADCGAIGLKVCALDGPPTPNSGGAEPQESVQSPPELGDLGGQEVVPQIANFNAIQTQLRSRSIQQGHARNRLQALPPPGRVPFGYVRSAQCYEIDPVAAPIVKALFDQFLLFGSVRGAVRYLKQNFGKTLSPSTALRWLTSPVYRGHLEYSTGDVIRDTHGALMSADEAAQVDRLLQRNRRLPKRAASSSRSLSGLVICKTCSSSMTIASVVPRKKSKPTYLYLRPTDCQACELGLGKKCGAIGYDEVLNAVIDKICDELPKAIAPLPVEQLKQVSDRLEQQILNKQKILEQVKTLETTEVLDAETATLRSYKLRAEISVLQSSQSRLPPTNLRSIADTVSIPAFWEGLSEPERRFYLREFLRRIEWVRSSSQGWTIELVFTF